MKPKIPTVRVPSDDCAINVGQVVADGVITNAGTAHHVHVDEWVEIIPVITVKEIMQIARMQQMANQDTVELGANLTALCQELSRRIIAWNWTDLMGEPIEQPYHRPDVLESLSSEELMWLMAAANGSETADARKKDSVKSEDISSETAPSLGL